MRLGALWTAQELALSSSDPSLSDIGALDNNLLLGSK